MKIKNKKTKIKKTKIEKFDKIVSKLIKQFEKKHGYEFSYWVSDDPTGIACFIDEYFFNLSDIYLDLKNNLKEGLIFDWQDYMLEHQSEENRINFKSYSMGLRYEKNIGDTSESKG